MNGSGGRGCLGTDGNRFRQFDTLSPKSLGRGRSLYALDVTRAPSRPPKHRPRLIVGLSRITSPFRAKPVAFLTCFAGESTRRDSLRLTRTALDVGGPCVEMF